MRNPMISMRTILPAFLAVALAASCALAQEKPSKPARGASSRSIA